MHRNRELPSVSHKGDIKPPFSHSVIAKIVSSLLPPENGKPSNEGSSVLGEMIYMLFLGLFGRSVNTTEYSYRNSLEGQSIADASKIIRILMYFFTNTFISIFFKDIELMYLNENHNIDDDFFNLGITLRQIHKSITNGMISFIYSIALNQELIGGAQLSHEIKLSDIVENFFIDLSFNEFKNLLMGPNESDPYNLREKTNKVHWENSFTKMLMNSKSSNKSSKKSAKDKVSTNQLKKTISSLSHIKGNEIDKIINVLEDKKSKSTSYKKVDIEDMLIGGSDSKTATYAYPGNDGDDLEKNQQKKNKYFFYKLFLLESLFNSDKFLESFEVLFNLMCRLINRLIKRLIPLVRNLTSKTLNNVAAFVFSLGGPFTEIFWFAFSSLLSLSHVGKTALNLADDFSSGIPTTNKYGNMNFSESSILKTSETEPLNDLVELYENITGSQTSNYSGGGKKSKIILRFDKQIKDCLDDFFSR